jgi:Ran GTPase-activating protein (RanGAP) involved in mRNA processing and transport
MFFVLLSLWLKFFRREDSTEELIHRLVRNDPSLLHLTLQGDELSEEALRCICLAIGENDTLEKLTLLNMHFDKTWVPQWLLPSLKSKHYFSLEIEECSEDDASTLAKALAQCRGLKSIVIRSCEMEPSRSWAELLEGNENLEELKIVYCHSLFTGVGEFSLTTAAIAHGMAANDSLRVLDLSGNALDDNSVTVLSRGITRGYVRRIDDTSISGLSHLLLDFNTFGDEAVESLARLLLVKDCALTELSLFSNRITNIGADSLASALYKNTSLTSLVLSLNQIGDRGVSALARSLTVNVTLQNLWFPSNRVGLLGMQVWGDLLPQMRGLESLNVGMLLEQAAADALCFGLKSNLHLNSLHMEMAIQEFEDDCQGSSDLDFWLRLNRSGRRAFLRDGAEGATNAGSNLPPGLCAKILARADNFACIPDVLFFMLKEKPHLVEGGACKIV